MSLEIASPAKKPDGRGGYRPGSGQKKQKPVTLSAIQVQRMLNKAKKYASRYGKDVDDILLDIIYTADESARVKVTAIKLFKDCTMAKIQEGGETNKSLGPSVFLPEHRPVLTAIEGGKIA